MATAQEHRRGIGTPQNLGWIVAVLAAVVTAFAILAVMQAIDGGEGTSAVSRSQDNVAQAPVAGGVASLAPADRALVASAGRLNGLAEFYGMPNRAQMVSTNRWSGLAEFHNPVDPALVAAVDRLQGLAGYYGATPFVPEQPVTEIWHRPEFSAPPSGTPVAQFVDLSEVFAGQGVESMNPYIRMPEDPGPGEPVPNRPHGIQ